MTFYTRSLAVFALALGATGALAQVNTATATASGSVTIIRPLTLTKNSDLQFGRIVRPSTGTGTVSMTNAADTVTAASGAVALSGITTTRASFTIAGEGGQVVTVSVPASFSMTDGTNPITVTLSSSLGATVTLSNALAAAGTAQLYVGGNFSVPSALTTTGAFTGSIPVTVSYQ